MPEQHPSHGTDLAVPLSATDHMLGSGHAPVVVIEYGDFQCPTCKQAAPAVKLLLERFANRVCVAFRHFPLEQAHPQALGAAEAAEAAGEQGKFWEMHDLLFANQNHLDTHHLQGFAGRLALELPQFTAELDDHVYLQRIREHQDSGRRSRVRGTPGFFVNGRIVDVSFGIERLFDAVGAALRG